jgi:very-short-patch-repair endonuclease
LRGRRLDGLRFRRQYPIGPYILDFYCASARLAVELDGAAHDFEERLRRDHYRDARLTARGIRIVRFTAAEVLDDHRLEGALRMTAEAASTPLPPS